VTAGTRRNNRKYRTGKFVMADKIQKAYRASKNIYDDVITQGSFLSKMYIKIFWSGTDDNEIARKVLSYIPDNFKGTILDVPVGTAVFTENKWKFIRLACKYHTFKERLVYSSVSYRGRAYKNSGAYVQGH